MVFKLHLLGIQNREITMKKCIARVVLSPQHKEILDNICRRRGQSESETLRMAFLKYAKKLSLVTEKVHS